MSSIDADEIGKTFDCKTPNCDGTATSPVGRYSYCSTCRERRASLSVSAPPAIAAPAKGNMEAAVKKLQAAAREADTLARHAKKLTERALEAKRNTDAAQERVRDIARSLAA